MDFLNRWLIGFHVPNKSNLDLCQQGIGNLTSDLELGEDEQQPVNTNQPIEIAKYQGHEGLNRLSQKVVKKISKELSRVYELEAALSESLAVKMEGKIVLACKEELAKNHSEESFVKNYSGKILELIRNIKVVGLSLRINWSTYLGS